MKYKVKFEIYGKRMQTTVDAVSKADAKRRVAEKLIFHEIKEHSETMFNIIQGLKDLGINLKKR